MRCVIVVSILLLILTPPSRADFLDLYFAEGTAAATSPGSFGTYYDWAFAMAAGAKIPFSLWPGYQQNWVEFDYFYFAFKPGDSFPIRYIEPRDYRMTGDEARVWTLKLNTQWLFRHETKRFVPYFALGAGYIKRSDMDIRTNSLDLPFIRTRYKGAGAFSTGLGLTWNIHKRFALQLDIAKVIGNTRPGKTSYWPFRLGMILR